MSDEGWSRQQICYQQNSEHARSLNTQMHRIPALAMTLTGGLWFGAGITANLQDEIRFALLMFAGLCNLCLTLAVLRVRDVVASYLEKIQAYHPESFAAGKPTTPKVPWLGDYGMISIYGLLMLSGALISFCGAFWKYWPFNISGWVGVIVLGAAFFVFWLYFIYPYSR